MIKFNNEKFGSVKTRELEELALSIATSYQAGYITRTKALCLFKKALGREIQAERLESFFHAYKELVGDAARK